jgi:hypothetical protein
MIEVMSPDGDGWAQLGARLRMLAQCGSAGGVHGPAQP